MTPIAWEYPEGGDYRYLLGHRWDDGPVMFMCMLNPSRATRRVDDPTVKQCRYFARAAGCGAVVIGNLHGLRSPHPRALLGHPDAVGPENDAIVAREAAAADRAVIAWGSWGNHPKIRGRRDTVLALLAGLPLWCLGVTAEGEPRHPVRMAHTTRLVRWGR